MLNSLTKQPWNDQINWSKIKKIKIKKKEFLVIFFNLVYVEWFKMLKDERFHLNQTNMCKKKGLPWKNLSFSKKWLYKNNIFSDFSLF